MPRQKHKRRYHKKPVDKLRVAREHIDSLFENAKQAAKQTAKQAVEQAAPDNMALANRYVTLARKIAMKFKIRLTSEQKRLFCPHCYRFLVPGKNLRVRVHEHRIIYYCMDCKKFWRKPVGKKAVKKE